MVKKLERSYPASHDAIIRLFSASGAIATNDSAAPPARIEALRLVRHDRRPDTASALLKLVSHGDTAIQTAAVEALAGRDDPHVVETVLARLPEQMPSVRRASLDLLLATEVSTRALLEAIESQQISATTIDAARAAVLKNHANEQIRELAQRVLDAGQRDRAAVVKQYHASLALAPNRANGHKVFAANCAVCHRLGGEGTAIGPDIGDSMLRKPEQLLADILQPNLAVDANYVNYAAVTVDGRVIQGVIRTESDAGIALATADGKTVTLARDDLESLTSSGASMMPDGLEKQISTQQMADLIDYIRNFREMTGYQRTESAGK
jgi:putative heme-binding domain-containing protein